MQIPFNHSNDTNTHPRCLKNLKNICSEEQPIKIIPNPTKRYLKKLTLGYLYCPDCASNSVTYYGSSSIGTQKYRCKECSHQFVSQFDAIFPFRDRHKIFDEEFSSNLKATGFRKGSGKKRYWHGARLQVLSILESQAIRVRCNKMLKTITIQGEWDYRILLEFIVNEAYVMVTE